MSKSGNPPRRRRFIAGAVCPQCGATDKIVVDPETETRSCVACDFEESRPATPGPAELATRVNRPAARRIETPAEAVTILDASLKQVRGPAARDEE